MSPSSTCYTARFAPNCAAADGFSSRSIDAARLRLPSIGGVDAASAAGGDTGDVVKGGKPAGIPPGNGPPVGTMCCTSDVIFRKEAKVFVAYLRSDFER